jgi:uncharacterized protein YndB with AHSA1/START domain
VHQAAEQATGQATGQPAEQEGRRRVRRSLDLEADRAAVWALLGDPDGLSSWLGAEARLPRPLRAGDRGSFAFPDGQVRPAQVEAVTPNRRLSWRWADAGSWTVVTLVLDEIGTGRTRVTVTEEAEETCGLPLVPMGFTATAGGTR